MRGPPYSLSNNQHAQSGGAKVNPLKSKSIYSAQAFFPTLLHGVVYQLGVEIYPRRVTWFTRGIAQTDCRSTKASWGISTTRGRIGWPQQAKIRRLVDYSLTQTENSECKRYTITSRSTLTTVTLSSLGMRSTPNTSCAMKEWTPRLE